MTARECERIARAEAKAKGITLRAMCSVCGDLDLYVWYPGRANDAHQFRAPTLECCLAAFREWLKEQS